MKRPTHTFKIGEQVYHHSGGLPGGRRTGPYTIVGRVRSYTTEGRLRQPDGTILYRIKNSAREQLVHPSELKLVLARARKASDE
jgi:hypothetical protein